MSIISLEQFLKGRAEFPLLPLDVQKNSLTTLRRVNNFLHRVGAEGAVCNDGLRIRGQHKPKNGAERSNHYLGAAIDIDDNDSAWLWKLTIKNISLAQEIGLWMEDPRWTHGSVGTWMHYQIYPPGSGKRIYVPSIEPASAPELWDGVYDTNYNLLVAES